jgi:hypothetical protein
MFPLKLRLLLAAQKATAAMKWLEAVLGQE